MQYKTSRREGVQDVRLIDADSLKPITIPNPYYMKKTRQHSGHVQVVLMKDVRCASTVDAVPVVRCKDCKHRHESEFCECRDEDAFCSDGERREQG